MATSIRMPQLGESVAEGTIGKWLKQPGDRVERDEPIVEVITDKVNAEIPSPVAGVIERIVVAEGTTVKVGQEIAVIGAGEAGQPSAAPAEAAGSAQAGAPIAEATRAGAPSPTPTPPPSVDGGRRFYTPVVMRMAAEHGIDLEQVPGTGAGGRVTRKDLERYLEARRAAPAAVAEPPAAGAPPAEAPARAAEAPAAAAARELAPPPDEEWLPVTPMRRAIAEHMVRSVQTAPHAWALIEVDASSLVRLRDSLLDEWKRREGFELTYLPFFIKAVVEAVKEHPQLNAVWAEDRIVLKKRVNVGVAVSVEQGLIVPVIRDADTLSIAGLARTLRDVVQRARAGKLTLEDVQGGTITVNNPGTFGSVMSQPIINQPQAAIITMEAIVKRPVVIDDMIAIRSMMNVCCSFDHRVTDGAQVLRFMQAVKRRVEGYGPDTSIY